MSAIGLQSRVSKNLERKRRVEVAFMDKDEIRRKELKKVEKFNTFAIAISSILFENPERVRRRRGSRGCQRRPISGESWKEIEEGG